MDPFFNELFQEYDSWKDLPLVKRTGDGWRGLALTVAGSARADLAGPLGIEKVGGEVTITLDYSHIHLAWPSRVGRHSPAIWTDAFAMIRAILSEQVVSVSGWIDGKLRAGSLQETHAPVNLLVKRLQHLRVRSWQGTFNRDQGLDSVQ